MKITFIGDVHGKFNQYAKLIKDKENTVQVGDMGMGFPSVLGGHYDWSHVASPPHKKMVEGNHRFIRGNHDNPVFCKRHSQWIPDGTKETIDGVKIMYVGGAWSIDWAYRQEGISAWKDEELSMAEFDKIIGDYDEFRPDIMVTHDFPLSVMHKTFLEGTHKPVFTTRTGQALDGMFSIHKPKLWVGGHWHTRAIKEIDGTTFIVLEELGMLEMTI